MANIGTLFNILWFLGTSLFASGFTSSANILPFNDDFSICHTFEYDQFDIFFANKHPAKINRIVIDAGHGGHDHGCSGKHSNEKTITLAIAKELGAYLNKIHPEIEVIFTRTEDKFVPLHERINLANKNKADIFLSIHANAFKDNEVSGTEVFVMGLHTAEENLKVAQRENASVLLENDFLENYDGYDPHSPEGQIILSMYQNVYLENSISIAKKISDHIAEEADFINRGVKQAGFVILRKAAMPSVLIETGFLSNKNDEDFLRSPEGQQKIARSIGEAISEYKNELEDEFSHLAALKEKTKGSTEHNKDSISAETIVFRVQLAAISKEDKELPKFIAEQAIDLVYEGGLKKMIAGKFKDYESASSFKDIIRTESTFPNAFVVAYQGKQRIGLNKAKQLKQSKL